MGNRKITVFVPEDILAEAQKSTGLGVSDTIRLGLKILTAHTSYEGVRKLKGKVKITESWPP